MQMAANDAIDVGKVKPLHIVCCEDKQQTREDPLITDLKNTWFAVPPATPSSYTVRRYIALYLLELFVHVL